MKQFIKYIAALVVITLVSMFALDCVYTYVYESAIPRNKTQYLLKLKNEKIDYVFLGSSRVENHIVTKLVEEKTSKKALNLGVQGGRLDDVSLMIKFLINNKIKTEKIFIQVDYLYNFENPSTIVGTESLPYIRSNKIISEHRRQNPNYNVNYYIPFYRYGMNDFKLGFREFFNCLVGKRSKVNFANGFEPKFDKFSNKGANLPETILKKNKNIEEINSICKENNIDVIYFCAPFCTEMKNIGFIDKLKNKLPNFIDFSREIKSNEYFKDCAHLNEKGAHLFTQKLIDSCLVSHK